MEQVQNYNWMNHHQVDSLIISGHRNTTHQIEEKLK